METTDERWAEALAIRRRYSTDAPRFVAARIGALALTGDADGVERWRTIAARSSALMGLNDDAPSAAH